MTRNVMGLVLVSYFRGETHF